MQEDWIDCYFQGQGHNAISYNQIFMTVSTISTELLIFLQPNLIGWFIVVSWNDLCQNWIVVFKVKVTAKVQNFIDSLCLSLIHI